jgi:hypothetical protein
VEKDKQAFSAIAFGSGPLALRLGGGKPVDLAYNIYENVWNGRTKLELRVKDIILPGQNEVKKSKQKRH